MQAEPQSRPLGPVSPTQGSPNTPTGSDEWTIVSLGPFRSVLKACGVRVISERDAQIDCPGLALHNSLTRADSCVVLYNGRWLRAFCFRHCCRQEVWELNRKLFRSVCGMVIPFNPVSSDQHCEQPDLATRHAWQQKQREREALERHATALFPSIQKECYWPAEAIKADSPTKLTLPIHQQHRYILDLYEDNDVLWCADQVNRTGQTRHRKYFRSVQRRWAEAGTPGAFTCPNTFEPGTFSRSGDNVAQRKFLVVESDDVLDRDHVGAVFRWLDKHLKLPLRAVVDTGNKSLHGWFEYPSAGLLEKLRIILPALGCDPAMFKPAQPCRMPGAWRDATRRWQELLYLAPSPAGAINTSAEIFASD